MSKKLEQQEKNNTKSSKILTIIILLLLIALASLGMYAYAKYVTSKSGTATAQITEFNFALKNLSGQSTSQSGTINFPITRTDGNTKVNENSIAPNTYGRFDMIIDDSGTEVSYRYDIHVTVTNCPTNLIFYSDSAHTQPITAARTGDGTAQDPKVATFTISKFVPLNKVGEPHKEIVYWNWPYETGTGDNITANDLIDSADMNKTVTMNIVATAMQVNSQPAGVPVIGTEPTYVNNIVEIELAQNGHRDVTINNGSQANVTIVYTQTPPPANLESISVVSSDSSVATGTVDTANNRIVINALKAGTATITVRGEQSWGTIGTIGVTVLGRVNELALSSDNSTVVVEKNNTQNVTITNFANVSPLEQFTITSSDSDIATATYDNNGTITITGGTNGGPATITLTGSSTTTTKTINVKVPLKIGDTVGYSTTLNGQTLNNWKLFYNDTTNDKVYLILGDYLPVAALPTGTGLATSGSYNVYSNNSRAELINAMTTISNWRELINNGQMNGTELTAAEKSEASAMGSPTLDLWVNSWNDSGYTHVNTATTASAMSDGLSGYYVYKDGESNTSTYTSLSSDTDGYGNTLYFTHQSGESNCYGYWLASPSAYDTTSVMIVSYDGYVNGFSYSFTFFGFRPVVCLPSSVLE